MRVNVTSPLKALIISVDIETFLRVAGQCRLRKLNDEKPLARPCRGHVSLKSSLMIIGLVYDHSDRLEFQALDPTDRTEPNPGSALTGSARRASSSRNPTLLAARADFTAS